MHGVCESGDLSGLCLELREESFVKTTQKGDDYGKDYQG